MLKLMEGAISLPKKHTLLDYKYQGENSQKHSSAYWFDGLQNSVPKRKYMYWTKYIVTEMLGNMRSLD